MTTPRLPTDSLIIDSVESEQVRGARVESKQRGLEDVRSERDGLEALLTRSRGELSEHMQELESMLTALARRFKQLRSAFGEADRRVQEAIEVTKAGRAALVEERDARAQREIELRSMAEPRRPVHADGLEAPRRLRGAQREVVELHARLDAAEAFDVAEESKEPSTPPQADLRARRTGSDGRSAIGSFLDVHAVGRPPEPVSRPPEPLLRRQGGPDTRKPPDLGVLVRLRRERRELERKLARLEDSHQR